MTTNGDGIDGVLGSGGNDQVIDAPPVEVQSVPEGFATQVMETVRARGNAYGTPAENHQTTADIWSTWLSRRLRQDIRLSAEDVCALNVLQKLSRAAFCSKDDTWLDVAGYTENVAMIRPDQRNHRVQSKQLDRSGYNGTFVKGDVVREVGEDREMTVEHTDGVAVECVFFDANDKLDRKVLAANEIVFVRR